MTTQDKLNCITDEVCSVLNVKHQDIHQRCRLRQLVEARQWVFYFARRHTAASLKQIGGYFDQDHATVLHGVRVIDNLMMYKHTKRLAEQIDSRIRLRIGDFDIDAFCRQLKPWMISNATA